MKKFLSTIQHCFALSFKSSKLYTIIRLGGKVVVTVNTIILTFIVKSLMDLLSNALVVDDKFRALIIIILILTVLTVINVAVNKLVSYAEGMHNEIIGHKYTKILYELSLSQVNDDKRKMEKYTYHCC